MKQPISISIFFPAYNEEANIEESVKKAEDVVSQITDTYELIIVNDGSSDATGDIADKLSLINDKVRVVHHNPNQGYGAALWSGIKAARYEYVFFTDADLQFDISELAILTHFVPHHDVVLGYRAPRKDPFMRLVNAFGWKVLMRFMFGLKVKDIDCAFKLMKRELVAGLPIKTRGAMMSAELLIRLQRLGVTFKEVPVTHLPRTRGSATGAKPEVILRALKEAWTMFTGVLGEHTRKEFGRFATVGVANTVIDIGLYTLMTRFVPFFAVALLLAKSLSFLAGTVFSFTFNRLWTFQNKHPFTWGEIMRFYATVGSALVINVASLYVFHTIMGVHDLAAVVLATGVSFVWNFVISKLWVFTNVPQRNYSYSIIK
jgi:glycosyltransferase involved in cell wall biosynthesis